MSTFNRRSFMFLGLAAFLACLPAAGAFAADREAELQERFKRRYDEVRDAKAAGKIGETREGVLDAVEAKYLEDKALRALVDEENADRRELYKLIAEKEQTTEAKVAERAAARNYQKARSGEYLKDRDGTWKRKK
jgi:uncharacterized protein YdbL (DUF1318 family)